MRGNYHQTSTHILFSIRYTHYAKVKSMKGSYNRTRYVPINKFVTARNWLLGNE